ncbi:hypothetical protein [Deinococcus yavapaiensis]|uniref:Tetratricopeptide repeat protein n=1 Tax=Deinococcus yavapaiensis KR-236 TaxID=694435 RepID=A0A318S0H6_9DEIO|nr:hypothetical protein [Deinococcus yavapaiensis]PYE50406.1 hypothetical protein DES52_11823 [Deinococcus yavapaiensis KR-236]
MFEHLSLAAAAFRKAGHASLEGRALAELGAALLVHERSAKAARALQDAVALFERSRPCAPVLRAQWAVCLARLGEVTRAWSVFRTGLSTDEPPPVLRGTLYWTAQFLLEAGQARTATLLAALLEAQSPPEDALFLAGPMKGLRDQLAASLLPEALKDAAERGRTLSLEKGVRVVEALATQPGVIARN